MSKKLIAGALALLLVGGAIGWAIGAVFAPPQVATASDATLTTTARHGTVEDTLVMAAESKWNESKIGVNTASGVVTRVHHKAGEQITAGKVLFRVNERPVIALQGDIPSFRGMHEGIRGNDVRQLQRFLKGKGWYKGSVTGKFDAKTTSAVKHWQGKVGISKDGFVRASDVIFVPTLPVNGSLDESVIRPGNRLVGGENVLTGVSGDPQFVAPLTVEQAFRVNTGTKVKVQNLTGGYWSGHVAEIRESDAGYFRLTLTAPDGSPICGDQCSSLASSEAYHLNVTFMLQEPVSGIMVPASAIRSRGGAVYVLAEDGTELPVTLVASAGGQAIVEGLAEGTVVRMGGAA